MPCCHVGALNLRHLAIKGRSSCVIGRKQACRAMILSGRSAGDNRAPIAERRSTSLWYGVTAAGSIGRRGSAEKAVINVYPLALGKTFYRDAAAGLLLIFEEEGIPRDIRAGVVD